MIGAKCFPGFIYLVYFYLLLTLIEVQHVVNLQGRFHIFGFVVKLPDALVRKYT